MGKKAQHPTKKKASRRTKILLFLAAALSSVFILFGVVYVLGISAWKEFDPTRITEASQTLLLYDGRKTSSPVSTAAKTVL